MKSFLLILLVACCSTACASRGGQNPAVSDCVVPASICQSTTAEETGGAPPTCGLCPTSQLFDWLQQTGCDLANLSCVNGGTIYLDDHQYYCCIECPDECEPDAEGGEGV